MVVRALQLDARRCREPETEVRFSKLLPGVKNAG
jgi:hypothetical protein